ncbi:hypothetical protein [Lactobacillus taiwanensis]|uniref:hypothetical protein n=1 Tax=Lactobacillus taiwanensis TaxID=508451 RepID=UPI00321F6119
MRKTKNISYKPNTDVDRWLQAQENSNASIRFLIQRAIGEYGIADVLEKVAYDGKFSDSFLAGKDAESTPEIESYVKKTKGSKKKDPVVPEDDEEDATVVTEQVIEPEENTVSKGNALDFFGV